ncbi:hypothetical protein CDL15_Pgr024079 [Punica granatum]|uniref:Malectin-like domain-containing protein n=1 Tax=Punica granatum TaxID=22663 RepID=A0A218XWI0_PUNGR|nr:hypothetical protein CDL15_Pgr024079 [Punica granatum]
MDSNRLWSGTSYRDSEESFWWEDENFIRAGENKLLSNSGNNNLTVAEQLNSLRVFTEQNKNCYILPVITNKRNFIKAGFHYGKHDGLSQPPMFYLEFNGKQWAAVSTSIVGPQHEELIYTSPRESISVSLARTQDGQYPFISTLELLPLPDGMYANMSSDMAWHTLYGYPQDKDNWGWQPRNESDFGVLSLTAYFTFIISTSVDYPPDPALLHAIMAPSAEFEFPLYFQGSHGLSLYFELHFVEPTPVHNLRLFDFYISDVYFYTVRPQYRNCTSFGIQSIDDPAVYLIPNKSDLPPIINAIEFYDSVYIQLQGWSGACLPLNSSWQWLTCSEFYPTPNVTSMSVSPILSTYNIAYQNHNLSHETFSYRNLSETFSYRTCPGGLQGHLLDFIQMRALKTM